jgi:hypothetical protein
MNLSWPLALVIATLIVAVTVFLTAAALGGMFTASRDSQAMFTASRDSKADAKQSIAFESLAASYRTLAEETKLIEDALRADLAALRAQVDSIERLLREVG